MCRDEVVVSVISYQLSVNKSGLTQNHEKTNHKERVGASLSPWEKDTKERGLQRVIA
jgi:hypothetical protein